MIPSEIYKLKDILDSFLGKSKNDLTESYQLQYSCPRCRELKGTSENRKFNLECNLRLGVFKCWSCSSHDDDMHGSLKRLIKLYGNEDVYEAYKETIYSLRQSKLFELNFNKEDFNIDKSLNVIDKEFELPSSFTLFNKNGFNNKKALDYLFSRNIGWDIIEKYNIGYTKYDENNKYIEDIKNKYNIITNQLATNQLNIAIYNIDINNILGALNHLNIIEKKYNTDKKILTECYYLKLKIFEYLKIDKQVSLYRNKLNELK
jgi:hypothetical protein